MILDDTSTAIYSYLSAGTALTALLPGSTSIYRTQAPDNATLPYVVFSHQAGGPELMTSQSLERNLWYIRAYSDVSQKDADEIFQKADVLLDGVNITLTGHHTINCWRTQNISFVENTPSKKIWNSGGLYEIRTSKYADYDWYVDSVNGSDSYDGKAADKPFATIAKLLTVLAAGDSVGLAKGSHWREQLTISVNNMSLYAYGSGNRPIIDGSNVMSGWSKTAGRTYVYQIGCTPEWGSNNNYLNVWEDGSFLVRAADLATCDSTAGTYYPSGSSGTITLYVHASDDGNPASNGKTYEYSHRARSIFAANSGITGLVINGIHTRCNLEENGSIFIYKQSTVNDCLIADGSKHNLYIGEGSTLSNTTLRDAYYGAGDYSLLVCYSATGTGLGFVCEDCSCENTKGGIDALGTGFYGHAAAGSLGAIVYRNIAASNLSYAVNTHASHGSVLIETLDAGNCIYGINAVVSMTISGFTHSIDTNYRSILVQGTGITINLSDSTLTLVGLYVSGGMIFAIYANFTINLDNVHFIGVNNEYCVSITGTGGNIYARNCDFESIFAAYSVVATGSINSDYNRFRDACIFELNGTTYNTLALWQAGTGNDLNSTLG